MTWNEISGISSEDIYRRFMLHSLHGQTKDAQAKLKPGSWEYDIKEPLYKYNMTSISAALGLSQLQRYSQILERRHTIINMYNNVCKDLPVQILSHYKEGRLSSGHLYMVRIMDRNETQRNMLIQEMAERGIPCNVHYKPLPLLTAYKMLGFRIEDFPNAYRQYQNELSLPLHTCLEDAEVVYIMKNFQEVLR